MLQAEAQLCVRITGTLHEDRCTFMIRSRCIFVSMKNVSDKSCRGNQNMLFTFSISPPSPENRAVYNIMWKNVADSDRPQMTI